MTDHKLTEKDLSDALENDEFLFFYQPILSLRSGKIDGAEALIRWQKNEGNLIPPGDFIPYAEQTGFIKEITKAMIPRFLEDQKKILQADDTIVSSINISAKDIMQEKFVSTFLGLLSDSGIDPAKIKFELTESSALSLNSSCLLKMAQLKAHNIELAIDDFGTGYATFERLKKLQFNNLKIDYTITHGAMATPDGLALLDHSINLAHQLMMDSIAEGVESEATLKYLMGIGCEQAQGYYISKPLDLSSFIEFISSKPVWDTTHDGYIYKAIIDYANWIRKVTSSLNMENINVRITPFEAEQTSAGYFLSEIADSIDIGLYNDLYTEYKKSFEVAKIMLNAKSSGDMELVDRLLPDYFKMCRTVNGLLQDVYSQELQHGLLEKKGFRK